MDNKQERKYLRAKARFWSMNRPALIKTAVIFCIALILHSAAILWFQHRVPSYDESNTLEVTTRVLDYRFERISGGKHRSSSTILFLQGEGLEFYANIKVFGMKQEEISELMSDFKSNGSVLTIRCVPPREFMPNYLEDGRYRILKLSEGETIHVDRIEETNKDQKAIRMLVIIIPTVIELIFVVVVIIWTRDAYTDNVLIHKRIRK